MTDQKLIETAVNFGAHKAAVMNVKDIPFNRDFRKACESNTCGNYGKCWTCPPDAGDIDDLIEKARKYHRALIYQTVSSIEDSFDIEGMLEAGKIHNQVAEKIAAQVLPYLGDHVLHLSAGGCRVCERCAKRDNLPCRHPDRAMYSMEAYGIPVSEVASLCGLKYINGQNTVTYFGIFLYE